MLIGQGKHLEQAKKFIDKNCLKNEIVILGYVEEIHLSSYFKLAGAFIAPLYNTIQDWARCPSKIYMYLPFQKPIITSKIGEARHIFKNNGLFFDPKHPQSLAEIMGEVCENKNRKIDYNLKLYSWHTRAHDFHSWFFNNFISVK
jgi:glycosyltransferase involved in cell wall biosynthesis